MRSGRVWELVKKHHRTQRKAPTWKLDPAFRPHFQDTEQTWKFAWGMGIMKYEDNGMLEERKGGQSPMK